MSNQEERTPDVIMREEGVRRFRAAKAKAVETGRQSLVGGARRLADVTISRLAVAVHEYVDLNTPKKKGRGGGGRGRPRPIALDPIKEVGVETCAYITTRTIFDALGQMTKFAAAAVRVGARLEDELRMRQYKKESKLNFGRALRDVGQAGSYKFKRDTFLRRAKKDELVSEWDSWPVKKKLHVGMRMIELLIESTGLFTLQQGRDLGAQGKPGDWRSKKKPYYIIPTEKCLALIEKGDGFEELMNPWFMPTLSPPVDWTTPWDGGYPDFQMPLIKRQTKAYYEGLVDHDLTKVYDAVNALQQTAWCINEDVLETYEAVQRAHIPVKGMPSREPKAMPPLLDWMASMDNMSEVQKEAFREGLELWQVDELKVWKKVAGACHGYNRRRESHLIAYSKITTVAGMMRKQPCFYMPYQLDWRGRVYPTPLFLNPQGCDLSRGLLRFAESKPFGSQEAIDWWKVEGSNRWGNDKVPFGERIQWVNGHFAEIMAVAEEPERNLWWTEADKPFQFLAWCLEFGSWVDAGSSLEFSSFITVSMDGSCNGLQHLSAMMLDKQGAEATNLLPSDRPQDIYANVCQKVELAARGDAEDRGKWGQPPGRLPEQWLASGYLNRSCVKQPVMTTPYGVTNRGMTLQIGDYLQKQIDDLPEGTPSPFEDGESWPAILYISPLVHDAIAETVVGANACMEWLMACAKVVAAKNLPLRWKVPTGLPVQQLYPALKQRRVAAVLLGSRRYVTVKEERGNGKCDKGKMKSSVSPNFVHSMDGAHLQLTVGRLEREAEGSCSWAMVHDSFGTHAADAGRMAVGLREVFVEMYQDGGALRLWREQVMTDTGLYLPEPPPQGDLDLQEVREALFFFA